MQVKSVYNLTFADGQAWDILSSEETLPLLRKLASIMELKSCKPSGSPKIILAKEGTLKAKLKTDWKMRDLGLVKLWSNKKTLDVICENKCEHDDPALDYIKIYLSLYPVYKRAQDEGGIPLHAALVEKNGNAVLLAAPGETGKSTCCRRIPDEWKALSDDETLVVRDKGGKYFAYPFPTWSDYIHHNSAKTWNVQQHVPLSAIFFLEQSPRDEAIPIGRGKATILINQSATNVLQRGWRNLDRSEETAFRMKLFENSCALAKEIPSFMLKVSMTGRFWDEMEKVLTHV